MVHIYYPSNLTKEEEDLQLNYAKLKKKKKQLQTMKSTKVEQVPTPVDNKKSVEAAADATEQAKKLLKSGAIKVEVTKKEASGFKRSKRKESEKSSTSLVGFQPFSNHTNDKEDAPDQFSSNKMKNLYESFVSSKNKNNSLDKDLSHESNKNSFFNDSEDSENSSFKSRKRPLDSDDFPKKGHTIYVNGVGISEDLLQKHFSNFGNIINISMETEKNCGFITFDAVETADEAISQMNGSMVSGVQLRVSLARKQPSFTAKQDVTSQGSWQNIASNKSQKGPQTHKDKRELVEYDGGDLFG